MKSDINLKTVNPEAIKKAAYALNMYKFRKVIFRKWT